MRLLASKVGRAWTLAALAAGTAHAADIIVSAQDGKFVRVDPVKPGTFDCDANKPPLKFTIDAAKEYHG